MCDTLPLPFPLPPSLSLPLPPSSSLPLQYEVSDSSLLSRTLWLSVWSRDLFGSNQFLGEALVPLKKYNLSTYTERWYLLKDKVGDS